MAVCPHHEAVEHRIRSAERRLGRIESGIIGVLLLLLAQLWMLSGLPERIKTAQSTSFISSAMAQENRGR